MIYTFYDDVGYQTAIATSTDLLHWDQSPGIAYSPRAHRPPVTWNATPGDFDYGGAAFVGPVAARRPLRPSAAVCRRLPRQSNATTARRT